MDQLQQLIGALNRAVWEWGIPAGAETLPFVVLALLGTGVFLTLRLGFLQVRRLGHGFAVASGK